MKKTIIKFTTLALVFSLVSNLFIGISSFIYADNSVEFENFYLNNAQSIKASKVGNNIVISGKGTIEIDKWMEMARKIDDNAFNKNNNEKWGWQGSSSEFVMEFESDEEYGIKLSNPYIESGGLFQNFKGEILFNGKVGLDENLTILHSMFSDAENANPDVSGWDTSNVTDMSAMFLNATSATPDVSGWDTSKVISMPYIFNNAKQANPDVSNWKTSNVEDMSGMFLDAENASPDVSRWDTSKVVDMHYLFYGAKNANPNVADWNTSNVTSMFQMFSNTKLSEPDVSNWDTSSVTNMSYMFYGAEKANPDVSNWNTSKVSDMSYMFAGTKKANPNVVNWDTSKVTDMSHMFREAEEANPDVNNWNTSGVTDMSYMFFRSKKGEPKVSNWNTSSVTDMSFMFNETMLANPDVSNWNTSKVTDMSYMFNGAKKANPDVSNWNTSNVTNMSHMFNNAASANPNVSNWDTSKVTNMEAMFLGAFNITDLDLSKFDFSSLSEAGSIQEMLNGMTVLESLELKLKYNYEFTNSSEKIYRIYERDSVSGKLSSNPIILNKGEKFVFNKDIRYLLTSKDLQNSSSGKSDTVSDPDDSESSGTSGKTSLTISKDSDKVVSPERESDSNEDENTNIVKKRMPIFKDVNDSDLYHDSIYFAVEKAIMSGISETEFLPEAETTRAMAVTILRRLSNGEPPENPDYFSDVEKGRWYSDSINWARKNKIVKGIGYNKFLPDGKLTREQFVSILYRYFKFKGYDTSEMANIDGYSDLNDISGYALKPFRWAISKGIASETSKTTISPKDGIKRGQVAAILEKFIKQLSE